MVNLVEAQKPLLHYLVKKAGLRQHAVDVDDAGTVMSFWVPKDKVPKKKAAVRGITPEAESGKPRKQQKARKKKPSVVLVHGFAAEGIVTWQFQVGVLAKHYDVYVPDLLYFGGSTSPATDRSPGFQAECLVAALRKLGVERCTVVGFSYGGMVAFKIAEAHPDLVRSLVVSGSVIAMTDSISDATLERVGVKSSSELLLPESVKGLKALLSIATYRKLWFPDRLHKDYLKVMFTNRKERAGLLEGLVISNKDAIVPVLPQQPVEPSKAQHRLEPSKVTMEEKEELTLASALLMRAVVVAIVVLGPSPRAMPSCSTTSTRASTAARLLQGRPRGHRPANHDDLWHTTRTLSCTSFVCNSTNVVSR